MDWTPVYVGAGVVLNWLILYFWQPWTTAYAGEKGKQLARKEDLNEILAEVRAVTITQKEIESKLAEDLWSRQTIWNQKRDTYIALFRAIDELQKSLGVMPTWIERSNDTGLPIETRATWQKMLMERLKEFAEAQEQFGAAYSMAVLFTNKECLELIANYSKDTIKMPIPPDKQWAEAQLAAIRKLLVLPSIAKGDLGISESLT